jgi:hypothetical protein
MNDKEFRRYLSNKRLERIRKEAEAANTPPRKPPATAKPPKPKKTRPA